MTLRGFRFGSAVACTLIAAFLLGSAAPSKAVASGDPGTLIPGKDGLGANASATTTAATLGPPADQAPVQQLGFEEPGDAEPMPIELPAAKALAAKALRQQKRGQEVKESSLDRARPQAAFGGESLPQKEVPQPPTSSIGLAIHKHEEHAAMHIDSMCANKDIAIVCSSPFVAANCPELCGTGIAPSPPPVVPDTTTTTTTSTTTARIFKVPDCPPSIERRVGDLTVADMAAFCVAPETPEECRALLQSRPEELTEQLLFAVLGYGVLDERSIELVKSMLRKEGTLHRATADALETKDKPIDTTSSGIEIISASRVQHKIDGMAVLVAKSDNETVSALVAEAKELVSTIKTVQVLDQAMDAGSSTNRSRLPGNVTAAAASEAETLLQAVADASDVVAARSALDAIAAAVRNGTATIDQAAVAKAAFAKKQAVSDEMTRPFEDALDAALRAIAATARGSNQSSEAGTPPATGARSQEELLKQLEAASGIAAARQVLADIMTAVTEHDVIIDAASLTRIATARKLALADAVTRPMDQALDAALKSTPERNSNDAKAVNGPETLLKRLESTKDDDLASTRKALADLASAGESADKVAVSKIVAVKKKAMAKTLMQPMLDALDGVLHAAPPATAVVNSTTTPVENPEGLLQALEQASDVALTRKALSSIAAAVSNNGVAVDMDTVKRIVGDKNKAVGAAVDRVLSDPASNASSSTWDIHIPFMSVVAASPASNTSSNATSVDTDAMAATTTTTTTTTPRVLNWNNMSSCMAEARRRFVELTRLEGPASENGTEKVDPIRDDMARKEYVEYAAACQRKFPHERDWGAPLAVVRDQMARRPSGRHLLRLAAPEDGISGNEDEDEAATRAMASLESKVAAMEVKAEGTNGTRPGQGNNGTYTATPPPPPPPRQQRQQKASSPGAAPTIKSKDSIPLDLRGKILSVNLDFRPALGSVLRRKELGAAVAAVARIHSIDGFVMFDPDRVAVNPVRGGADKLAKVSYNEMIDSELSLTSRAAKPKAKVLVSLDASME